MQKESLGRRSLWGVSDLIGIDAPSYMYQQRSDCYHATARTTLTQRMILRIFYSRYSAALTHASRCRRIMIELNHIGAARLGEGPRIESSHVISLDDSRSQLIIQLLPTNLLFPHDSGIFAGGSRIVCQWRPGLSRQWSFSRRIRRS